jgi:hypothetical protein
MNYAFIKPINNPRRIRMEQNKTDKNFSQQPKKTDMPSKTASKSTRPEIDLPLKGGKAEADLASKNMPHHAPKKDEKNISDKKSVR